MLLHFLLFFLFLLELPSAWWVAFSWVPYVLSSKGALTTPSTDSCVGREPPAGKRRVPAVLTLLCPSCLPMPGTSWDNTGTGAKLVTSNCHIKAESCIHSLLTHLCSVLGVFRFLYFLRVSHVLGPNILLLKLLL